MARGKTIQIYLPDGNPQGAKIINIPDFPIKAILVPKNLIKETNNLVNLKRMGIYFLFNEKEEEAKYKAYIGEGIILDRISNHYRNKDDWNFAVCFYSDSEEGFNKSQITYLESHSINEAKDIGRVNLNNMKDQILPKISMPEKDLILRFFDELKIILGTLGYPIFEKIKKAESEEDIFYCKSDKAEASGNLTEEGFVVYAGSKANLEERPSANESIKALRKSLFERGVFEKKEDHFFIMDEVVFSSPSAASMAMFGRSSNGWNDWKNKDGKTLDEIKRKEEED
jgi:hypothetical protein